MDSSTTTRGPTILAPASASTEWYNNPSILMNIILVLLFLAILGVNLLTVAGNLVGDVARFVGPTILDLIFTISRMIGEALKIVIYSLSNGLIFLINLFTGASISFVNILEGGGSRNVPQGGYMRDFSSSSPTSMNSSSNSAVGVVQPAASAAGNKEQWCLIGESQGFKTCMLMNSDDVCQSQKVFPTRDLCVNPNTRSN